jgi:hypothetical protein
MKSSERDQLPSLFPSAKEQLTLTKEVRWDRLYRPILIGGVPFVLLAVVHQTLLTILILQAYMLTVLLFGYLLFVEERDNISKVWLWKAMIPISLVHAIALMSVFFWDKAYPDLANKGLISTSILSVFGLIEYFFMLWLIELFRPSDYEDPANTSS